MTSNTFSAMLEMLMYNSHQTVVSTHSKKFCIVEFTTISAPFELAKCKITAVHLQLKINLFYRILIKLCTKPFEMNVVNIPFFKQMLPHNECFDVFIDIQINFDKNVSGIKTNTTQNEKQNTQKKKDPTIFGVQSSVKCCQKWIACFLSTGTIRFVKDAFYL